MDGQELLRQGAHLSELTHVGQQVRHVRTRHLPAHPGHGPLGPLVPPGRQHHPGAESGHAHRGRQSQARGRPGHQHRPTAQRRWRGPPRRSAPQRRPEGGEAPDDGGLEDLVDDAGHHLPGLWAVTGGGRAAEDGPQPTHTTVADRAEEQREHRIGQGEGAQQRQVGVVGQDRPPVGGCRHGHRVLRSDGVRLAHEHHLVRAFVGDDPVVERDHPRTHPDAQPEGAPRSQGTVVETLGRGRARVPLGGVGKIGEVVERLLGRPRRDDGAAVAGHAGSSVVWNARVGDLVVEVTRGAPDRNRAAPLP